MKSAKAFATVSCVALFLVMLAAQRSKSSADPTFRGRAIANSTHPRELWVTHQRDSAISTLKFTNAALLDEFSLPAGTQPHIITFHSPTLNNAGLTRPSMSDYDEPLQINFVQGKIAFEFVGQATNFAPTPSAPLGSAHQYGFLTLVRGIDNLSSGSPHNETTAVLTFFNEVTVTDSFTDGPLRIIDRNGTTTIYLNTAPASFANPDSFRSGIPVLTETLHQQAVNTGVGTFTAVFANTISSTSAFTVGGTTFRLGQAGQSYRAIVTGQSNATPPPNAHFSGYAVGVGEDEE